MGAERRMLRPRAERVESGRRFDAGARCTRRREQLVLRGSSSTAREGDEQWFPRGVLTDWLTARTPRGCGVARLSQLLTLAGGWLMTRTTPGVGRVGRYG